MYGEGECGEGVRANFDMMMYDSRRFMMIICWNRLMMIDDQNRFMMII